MAHESFEDAEIAEILNHDFVSIKVDKEERPDIDNIYMSVCQIYTGRGGWPTSIFMTHDQRPFFAGTYYPKTSKYNMIGFLDLLQLISEKWLKDRANLIATSKEVIKHLNSETLKNKSISHDIFEQAINSYKYLYDNEFGGFGGAPKFPSPHNLMFLLDYYERFKDNNCLAMVETTLLQMYKGGIFDHIGFGFSRYSTDKYFLIPHFEKMLYDNALLILAYTKAYDITQKDLYKDIAEKTAKYIMREMTDVVGGFYSAQDADIDGVEGKYYAFDYEELVDLLGSKNGIEFNQYYGITREGNFEGNSVPNLLHNTIISDGFDEMLSIVYEYRKSRNKLHLDDKILTSWNSLMIASFTHLYQMVKNSTYLEVAIKACNFIEHNLCDQNTLYVSYRNGIVSNKGFLNDYSFYIFALINLYDVTLEQSYLNKAISICDKVLTEFHDDINRGFFIYGDENEQLIMKPKETYDGAIPSGNSVMCYNLLRLSNLAIDKRFGDRAKEQLDFMFSIATSNPMSYSFYLSSLLMYHYPNKKIVCVLKDMDDKESLKRKMNPNRDIIILVKPTEEYKLLNNKTTFYLCTHNSCLPPTNSLNDIEKYNAS